MRLKKVFLLSLTVFSILVFGLYTGTNDGGVKEVSAESFLENIEDGFIYIGRPTCPYCEEFYPRLEKVAKETGETVHYINTDQINAEERARVIETFDVEFVPYFIEIRDGRVLQEFQNLVPEDEQHTLDNLQTFIKKQE